MFVRHVRIHQRKKEGGTYSPREAEIIETKCKLDQLIAVADLELKQEKLNRLVFDLTVADKILYLSQQDKNLSYLYLRLCQHKAL